MKVPVQYREAWNKINRVDENYAEFLGWTIKRLKKEEIELERVVRLAQQCPQTDGSVVFAAQNLYNAITGEYRVFTTSCDEPTEGGEEQGRGVNPASTPAVQENINAVSIYPNPVKTMVYIKGTNLQRVEVLSATGAVLLKKEITGNTAAISLAHLSSGMYFIKITDKENKNVVTRKIFKNLY
jgi:hypothetical protein